MLTEGATLTRTTFGFHTAMDTEATTAALCTACLAFTMLADTVAAARFTDRLAFSMWALLADPHVAEAVHRRCW